MRGQSVGVPVAFVCTPGFQPSWFDTTERTSTNYNNKENGRDLYLLRKPSRTRCVQALEKQNEPTRQNFTLNTQYTDTGSTHARVCTHTRTHTRARAHTHTHFLPTFYQWFSWHDYLKATEYTHACVCVLMRTRSHTHNKRIQTHM